jgi:anthranilate synthase component II
LRLCEKQWLWPLKFKRMKILVLDNYDSFTYNLVHILRELGSAPDVIRNDKISVEEVGKYDKILISPGPGIPQEAGILKALVHTYGPSKSILGICLGLQGIAEVYGASLYNLPQVLHGVTSLNHVVSEDYLFRSIPSSFTICHYHSWAVDEKTIPPGLVVTARNQAGIVMALRHQTYDVRGVQFHPESVMTEHGKQLMTNWLTYRT